MLYHILLYHLIFGHTTLPDTKEITRAAQAHAEARSSVLALGALGRPPPREQPALRGDMGWVEFRQFWFSYMYIYIYIYIIYILYKRV